MISMDGFQTDANSMSLTLIGDFGNITERVFLKKIIQNIASDAAIGT